MASFGKALAWVLKHEGGWSDHPNDKGGPTNYGITLRLAQRYGVKDAKALFNITQAQVEDVYRTEFWRFDGLKSDAVAAKIFDMAVNMGLRTAVRYAQRAVNDVRVADKLAEDGTWGPMTEQAVNATAPSVMVENLKAFSLYHYDEIVERDPSQMVFMKGWTRRAESELPDA
mgnify:FL=1